ncbi:integrator complex subunit, putative [Phytophthora infestans T30-4]|uniref:Integrator complex subunit, putative n=2 Tax=Phytophthora infestans TaxID=4787 RepID=D0MZY4_PHYIT|nr:integrator complex subunit, putative [Phytophthora infestans T30-4]EEY65797.1 integrator complex subunit, putative [Phytophthora infestans T30-4]KAF4047267.1 Beta-Casp domain [Phytophthora infestans]KAF4139458.1 Beta-Casp domain [Phytophthora infestans]|eukprot:XP_002906396.1 integrator complex subunit, putative [Phytophthora infestans T30-4]
MSLSVERLGNGAAFCLRDEITGVTVLLGCGEVKDISFFSPEDASAEDFDAATMQYRRDLKDLLRRDGGTVDAILVPDYRPGACYMLPYVTEKCGVSWVAPATAAAQDPSQKHPPAILMTHGTRAIAPLLLAEYWTGCHTKVKDGGSGLPAPYDVQDIAPAFRKTKAVALKACVTVNDRLKVTAYHSGHVAGGCAFYLEIGATTVLFANDFNLTGGRVLLPAQIPRLEPTAMITRSSFAVTVSETQSAMERELVKAILECIASNGKVVIPVYRLGYFHELITIILEHWQQIKDATGKTGKCPIYLSHASMEYPSRFLPVLSRTCTSATQNLLRDKNPIAADLQVFDWKNLQQPGPFVLFTGPANISQGDSLRAIKAVASDPKNLIVLSEYCTPGTVNYLLYADPERKRVSKRLGVNVECGVHYQPCGDEVDTKSIVQLVSRVAPRQVILDYTVPDDLEFVKTHVQNHLKMDPDVGTSVLVKGINPAGRTSIEPGRDIPLRIHKAMFNNPSDVQGMLIAEPKRKLMLVSSGNGARRLKKKKHSLFFSYSWKKPFEPSPRVKKKSLRPASALSFLLSAAVESADEEDESEQQPQADADQLLEALESSLTQWILDLPIEKIDRWLKVRTVGVSVSTEWEVHMEWSYDDEVLAGRVLGIAKQVVHAEYKQQLAQ